LQNNRQIKKRRKRMAWVTVILILVSVFMLVAQIESIPYSNVLRDTVANVEYYVIKAPLSFVQDVFSEYNDLKYVYRENKRLKRSLDNYAKQLALNDALQEELDELKELTGNDSLATDYKVKYTEVIQRDAENWDNTIIVNAGKNDDVEEGMAVITSSGVVGYISEVSAISSEVTLYTSENNKVQLPVQFKSDDETYYGLLNSYDVESGTFQVSILSTVEDKVTTGGNVITSGLGGSNGAPKGLLLGTVTGYSAGDNATGKTITVEPAADFDSMNYVAVVKRSS